MFGMDSLGWFQTMLKAGKRGLFSYFPDFSQIRISLIYGNANKATFISSKAKKRTQTTSL